MNSNRTKIGFFLFATSLLIFNIVLGGNIYQIIVEIPNWSSNIPDSLILARQNAELSNAGYFFQSLVPITLICLIVSVFLLRNRPKEANKWLLINLGGILIAEIFTGIYFLPRNFILFFDPLKDVPVEVLHAASNEWISANYIRTTIVVLTSISFLKTFRILNKE